MEFTKMHGLGNDYIYFNCMQHMPDDPAALSRQLSHRHFGVGGDGIICICPSEQADFRMRMFNADGSEGAMCGNGIRCVGKYVYEKGLTAKRKLVIETLSGMRELELHLCGDRVIAVTVDMGVPEVKKAGDIYVKGRDYTGIEVSMGNPHFVIQTSDPETVDLATIGPLVESHLRFPGGINVEFVRVVNRGRLTMRVWERGSGETMACGTGACAALAALASHGRAERRALISMPGGELALDWRESDGHMRLTGPAVEVFEGRLSLELEDEARAPC